MFKIELKALSEGKTIASDYAEVKTTSKIANITAAFVEQTRKRATKIEILMEKLP